MVDVDENRSTPLWWSDGHYILPCHKHTAIVRCSPLTYSLFPYHTVMHSSRRCRCVQISEDEEKEKVEDGSRTISLRRTSYLTNWRCQLRKSWLSHAETST